jgi:hypothetical protein
MTIFIAASFPSACLLSLLLSGFYQAATGVTPLGFIAPSTFSPLRKLTGGPPPVIHLLWIGITGGASSCSTDYQEEMDGL